MYVCIIIIHVTETPTVLLEYIVIILGPTIRRMMVFRNRVESVCNTLPALDSRPRLAMTCSAISTSYGAIS